LNTNLVNTDSVLLVGRCERDGGDHGTSALVWLRPNVDGACPKAIMTGFDRGYVCGRATVGESGRFIEV